MEMSEEKQKQIVHSFFGQHPLVTLTTINNNCVPQTAAVYIYVDADMNCYCVSRETTRKYDNILANSTATVSAFDENVLMFGELLCCAEIVYDNETINTVLPELHKIIESRKTSYWIPPVSQIEGTTYTIFKLVPKKATFVNYTITDTEAAADPTQIIIDF